MTTAPLLALAPARRDGVTYSITSVCSAHPVVLSAALALGRARDAAVLIEATCNQVNQEGGYTGLTPARFRALVLGLADSEGFDAGGLILGGDHLGPNPWAHLGADEAMDRACAMVAAYAEAGFEKIHLDASMACADDPAPLPGPVMAARAARLAAVAEARAAAPPVYVIGTEVPTPGGALDALDHLAVTTPDAARETVDQHRDAFARAGVAAAMDRVVGLVVQPGVEFGDEGVSPYDPAAARALTDALATLPMLYEAHSTDYQTPQALAAMARDGFGILKVGPALTFALREALYGLDHIADVLMPDRPVSLRAVMEALMLDRPEHWARHLSGDAGHLRRQRHYGLADRIRYYWSEPTARQAVAELMDGLGTTPIPGALISQHLGAAYADVQGGRLAPRAADLLRHAVTQPLSTYAEACRPRQ